MHQKDGCYFLVQSVILCLFIGELRPRMWRDINEKRLMITVTFWGMAVFFCAVAAGNSGDVYVSFLLVLLL